MSKNTGCKAGDNSYIGEDYYRHYKCIRPIEKEYNLDKKTYISILNDVFEQFRRKQFLENFCNIPNVFCVDRRCVFGVDRLNVHIRLVFVWPSWLAV